MAETLHDTRHTENSIARAADRKNQYYSLLYSEMAERKRVENHLRRLNLLLQALSKAQLRYVAGTDLESVFSGLLKTLLDVTQSWQGFLRERIDPSQTTPTQPIQLLEGQPVENSQSEHFS